MEHLMAIVLAAGEGKRMKSAKSKVTHRICGKALVEWVYSSIRKSGINECVIVVGHKAEQVMECMGDRVQYAVQDRQLGTGHAVMQAASYLEDKEGHVFVLCGDTPLISEKTISDTLKLHKDNDNAVTVVTAVLSDAAGYGRVARDKAGRVTKIVEHRDANEEERRINEVNSGMYCFNIKDLLEALKELDNNNSQGEYYLTDTIEILLKKGKKAGAFIVADNNEILGINDRVQLSQASEILRRKILTGHMMEGVTIIDPAGTFIDDGVKIGMDTIIYPGTIIEGGTIIGDECIIGPNSRIVSSKINNRVQVNNSVIISSTVDDETHIGPFAYLRPDSSIGRKVKIGDFVEIKKSVIGDNTKVSHLTYIGDAEVGSNVNMGCGVVVVNYDGKKKYKTVVGDNAFVGCNVNLISPVNVGANSYIAAGSTITDPVPENSLAIARERQIVKEEWVIKKDIHKKEKEK